MVTRNAHSVTPVRVAKLFLKKFSWPALFSTSGSAFKTDLFSFYLLASRIEHSVYPVRVAKTGLSKMTFLNLAQLIFERCFHDPKSADYFFIFFLARSSNGNHHNGIQYIELVPFNIKNAIIQIDQGCYRRLRT